MTPPGTRDAPLLSSLSQKDQKGSTHLDVETQFLQTLKESFFVTGHKRLHV